MSLFPNQPKPVRIKRDTQSGHVSSSQQGPTPMPPPTQSSTTQHPTINAGNLLPPKTVRQLKQRSAERQLTSSSIITQPTLTTRSSSGYNTFNEQNRHLRKLSSSIQSLHQSQPNILLKQLPPQRPRSSSKSPQLTQQQQESVALLKLGIEEEKDSMKPLKTSNTSEFIYLEKKFDSDQMSSSSSQNDDLDQNQVIDSSNNLLDTDDNHNQSNNANFQLSSNSLTSSSSSSCSLFENVSGFKPDDVGDKNKSPNENVYKLNESTRMTESSRLNELEFALNNLTMTNSSPSLKKPITFATIAAAANSGSSPPLSISINQSPNSHLNHSAKFSPITYSKAETILNEFKQILYNLHFAYSQVSFY